jgi:TatD DNase family protein
VIDFHCHIDLYRDPTDVLDKAEAKGVYLLAITTTPLAWKGMLSLVAGRRRMNIAAGLHPELVAERFSEISLLEELIPQTRYVGEVGLDGGPRSRGSFQKQDEVFRRVLNRCQTLGGRVLSIHSRAAPSGVLDALAAHPAVGIPILHWFSGSQSDLDRAAKLGCWFSVGPAMLRSAKGRRLVELMPADRMLTETDAPFAQDGHSGPLMPWDVSKAEADLAEIWGSDFDTVRHRLHENLCTLVERAKNMRVFVPAGLENKP